jgi:tetratricopeptide (TPR) repeat protein
MQMLADPANWNLPIKYVLQFLLLFLSGGFGGLVYAVAALLEGGKTAKKVPASHSDDQSSGNETGTKLNSPRVGDTAWVVVKDAPLASYVLGQVIIGMGGAMAGIFAALSIGRAVAQASDGDFLFKSPIYIVSLCVISGFIANKLLPAVAQNVLNELTKVKKTVKETQDDLKTKTQETRTLSTKQLMYSLGESYRFQEKWNDARSAFKEALALDPQNNSALLGLAATAEDEASKTLDDVRKKTLLSEALEHSNRAIAINPRFAPAYLTRATVNAMLDAESNQVREDLEHADDLDKTLKPFIAEQQMFSPLYNLDWFRSRFKNAMEKGV